MVRIAYTLCFYTIIISVLFSCRPEGIVVREDKEVFTFRDQAKIGNVISRHILENPAKYPIYRPSTNPEIYEYLDLLRNTVQNTMFVQNRNVFNWDVFVVKDSERITLFSTPGGKIYITDGFLRFMDTEAQLLMVLSHEMYYADQGITMDLLQKNYDGIILGDLVFNNPVASLDDMIGTLREDSLTPEDVTAADEYSLDIICQFQYNSDALSNLLAKQPSDEKFPLEWMDIRPNYENRIESTKSRLDECGGLISEEKESEQIARFKTHLNYLD